MAQRLTRRRFLVQSGAAAVALSLPSVWPGRILGANERLGIAAIGVGGKGDSDLAFCESETIVALCGNDLLVQTYRGISNRVRALRNRMPRAHERYARAVEEHKKISLLVSRGGVKAAADELAAHVHKVEGLLLEGIHP